MSVVNGDNPQKLMALKVIAEAQEQLNTNFDSEKISRLLEDISVSDDVNNKNLKNKFMSIINE